MEPMSGAQRRKIILSMLKQSDKPLSGGALGRETGVSRQVVVQDIALLRTQGYDIVATARGYMLETSKKVVRVFKVFHMNDRTEEELTTIVDLGGCVVDIMVNHRVYGKVVAPINIGSRRDVAAFMKQLETGKSTPLFNVTSGYHFHTVTADSEEVLDDIEQALRDSNLLADILPYEQELIDR